jgi:hypothetical protein
MIQVQCAREDMDSQPIAIAVLQQALDANHAQILTLEAEIMKLLAQKEELRRAIEQLQAASLPETEKLSLQAIDPQTAAAILEQQEQIDEKDYPVENLKGKMRIEIARMVAKDQNGYLAPSAFKRILLHSGVLKGTSQVASIASRVLSQSSDFEKVWEGLYRLKTKPSKTS